MASAWRGGRSSGRGGGRFSDEAWGSRDGWGSSGGKGGGRGSWGGSWGAGWNAESWDPAGGGGDGSGGASGSRRWQGGGDGGGGVGTGAGARGGGGGGRGSGAGEAALAVFGPIDGRALASLALCPDPGRGGFTATYEREPPSEGFASVNAGNGRSLHLGGSGLNGQFARDLGDAGLSIDKFQHVHQDLMARACAEPGALVEACDASRAGLVAAFGRVARADGAGFAAVDVFREGARPLHAANVAMVYCVGPDRRECGSDAEFLASIAELGESLALACAGYAARAASAASGLPPLRRVRVALVSGGKYSGKVSADLVAQHLLRGLVGGIGAGLGPEAQASDLTFELAYADACFAKALACLQSEFACPSSGEVGRD